MTDQRFRRGQHIRHRTDFQHVYDRGRKLHGRTMTIFLLHRPRRHDAAGDCRHQEDWRRGRAQSRQAPRSARFFAGIRRHPATTSSSCRAGQCSMCRSAASSRSMSRPWDGSVRQRDRGELRPGAAARAWRVARLQAASLAALHRRVPVSSVLLDVHGRRHSHPRRRLKAYGSASGGWRAAIRWARPASIPYRLGGTDRSWKSAFFSLSSCRFSS